MGYIDLFFEKHISRENITKKDVERFIEEKHEESIHVEYKGIPESQEVDFDSLAKHISAFFVYA